MTVSPVASAEKIATALTNLGTPDGFIAYDVVPLLQQLVVALGNVTSGGGGGSSAITGEIKIWTTNSIPSGYLLCDGVAVSRTTYASLFAVIGETYGAGDGSSTFNLPDLTGRVPVGVGGAIFSALGVLVGEESITLNVNEIPPHVHSYDTFASTAQIVSGFDTIVNTATTSSATTQSTGGGDPHNNIQPSLAINFIIKI